MKQMTNFRIILAFCISIGMVACKGKGKTEEAKTTDTTATTKTEPVQPPMQVSSPDAVTAAGNFYKVVADSLGIRVLQVTYKPGDSSVLHSHPDYAVYAVETSSPTFYAKDGTKMAAELKAGSIQVRPGEEHSVKNTGKSTLKVMLFEVNRPKQMTTPDASTDATKVAPDLYKVKGDSLGIRVLWIDYKPGQSSAMHMHPDNALYVINGGTVEFTAADGTKQTMKLPAGAAVVRGSESHSVKNTGNTELKAILVEVNRPRQ